MFNQSLSNITEPYQDINELSDSFQQLDVSRPLCQKKDEYIEDFRSDKRNAFLEKKRLAAINSVKAQEDTFGQGISIEDFITNCLRQTYTWDQMDELITCINSPNLYRQHLGAIGIRKLAASEHTPLELFIDAGIIPRIVEFVEKEGEIQLQLEAAWILANIAAGAPELTKAVVDNGAMPGLVKLLKSPHIQIRGHAAFALGNIACDNKNFRDIILQEGAIDPVIGIIQEASSIGDMELIQQATWTLSILCRQEPLPPYEAVKETLPIFVEIIKSQTEEGILSDALWSLVSLSDMKYNKIQQIFDTGVVSSLPRLVEHPANCVSSPSMRIIANICSGPVEYIDMLLEIDNGILEELFDILSHKHSEVRKYAAQTISNIIAGNEMHKRLIMENASYLDRLFEVGTGDLFGVRMEVTKIMNGFLTDPTPEQWNILMEDDKIVEYFIAVIEIREDRNELEIGLKGIQRILELGGDQISKEILMNIEIYIGTLRDHPDPRISQLALEIWNF